MRAAMDFSHPDALADALLHPLDRAYTVPQLYAWLERCGMSFGRWVEQAPYLPQCGMVAKTPHAARLASLPAPSQHAAVELFRGTMVRHKLIAYRDDRAGDGQPITLVGRRLAAVRADPPARGPSASGSGCPRGSVAVLINRAHPFPDLVLPVDSAERSPARRDRRPANPGRNSPVSRAERRWRAASPGLLRAALAVRPGRL